MNKLDVKRRIRSDVGSFLSTLQFKRQKGEDFFREVGDYKNEVSFGVTHKKGVCEVSYGVGISNVLVCDLLYKVLKQNWTYGGGIYSLTDEVLFKWCIDDEASLEAAIEDMQDYFIQYALPFFEKYSSYPSIVAALTSMDRRLWLSVDVRYRKMMAIAYEAVYGEKEMAIKRADDFLLETRDPRMISRFEKLKELISQN